MGAIATATVTAGKLISFGVCLGIGFWASKKLTNVADEYLLKWNEHRLQKEADAVHKELNGE